MAGVDSSGKVRRGAAGKAGEERTGMNRIRQARQAGRGREGHGLVMQEWLGETGN